MSTIRNSTLQRTRADERIRFFLITLFCLIAIFQSGLRDINHLPPENDTVVYQEAYERCSKSSWSELWRNFSFIGSAYSDRDAGYPLFMKATQLIRNDFTFFMFLTAIIFIIPFGLLIGRYVHSWLGVILSFLIYFALFTNIVNSFMRQAVTLGIFLFSLRYVIERSWIKYYGLILIAITIHTSTLVVLPFYFLPKLNLKRKWILGALFLFPVLVYYISPIMSLLLGGTVYENYIAFESENPVNYALFVVGVSLFAFMAYKDLKSIPNYDILICGVFGSLALMPITFLGNVMLRVSFYYVLILLPLIPALIDKVKIHGVFRLTVYALAVAFFLYLIIR